MVGLQTGYVMWFVAYHVGFIHPPEGVDFCLATAVSGIHGRATLWRARKERHIGANTFPLQPGNRHMTTPHWTTAALPAQQDPPSWFQHGTAHVDGRFIPTPAAVPDRQASTPELVSQVDFDADRLLYLAGVGPDGGCHRIAIDEMTVTDDTVSIEAHVACEASMATQVLTFPAVLVWIKDVTVEKANVTVVDGWQEAHTVTVSSSTQK